MERLDLLEKIYQYGETLSSEEMNQIVSYINIIIDAVNSLIRNNNGISSSHCEMRYTLSATQPQKPATGTSGLTNGWSNLYLLPEVGSGKSTWMSMCFVTGENVYGEWSTPVCINSGTVTGQQGPKGNSGESGAFVSRVFKRQNTKPSTPVGGTYSYPIPNGWYDGVPEGTAIIWSSTCTFYGNGTQTRWSEPAQESDTDTLDVEFSPRQTQPSAPLGNTPYSNHESEGWYDPNSPNFNSAGIMIWRAERKVSNGEYNGDWTITRIFGEKGEKGLRGETGGHYEFRYINFKATPDRSAPIKPANGTDGTSGGWSRDQQALTELEIKEGTFTWMTQCYLDENNTYGVWTTPIRITGANGIDGEDGTEQEFMYTRNNTGTTPATPPRTQKNEASLFGDLGYWTDPNSGVIWTDDPQGVTDNLMWEFVTTRVKEGTIWGPFSTPVVWAKWGKQGKIGQMSYLAGVWDSQTTYTKNAEKSPVVYYNGNYYYLKGEINSSQTTITSTNQNPVSRTDIWAQAENFEMVFTDILFVNEFAKLGSFIISQDWLISKNGTLYESNGTAHDIDDSHSWSDWDANSAYTKFDPSSPDKNKSGSLNFVPAIAIDSLSGRCFFWKGYFKGDIYANSLHIGNNDLSDLPSTLTGISNNLSRKIEVDDVTVISNGINKKIKVGNNTYDVIDAGDFLLTNVGVTGDGYYFKVSKKGLLEAHNALIYGTVFATSGQFSGSVNATQFMAGDPGGLNITTTGDAISFNYGGDQRAWFTTKDENGDQTNGMFLYIKGPNGELITIDFTNLSFKNASSVVGSAIQQKNFYSSITDSSFSSSIFINSVNGKYYSNSQLTTEMNNGTYYEKIVEGHALVAENNYNIIYPANFFNKVSFSNGSKVVLDSNYWVSAVINGTIKELRGTSSNSTTFHDYDTYLETTSNLISDNSALDFNGSSIYAAQTGTNGGGKITNIIFVGHQGGATIVGERTYTIHS